MTGAKARHAKAAPRMHHRGLQAAVCRVVHASALTIARDPMARTMHVLGTHVLIGRPWVAGAIGAPSGRMAAVQQGARRAAAGDSQTGYGNPASTEPPQVGGTYCTDLWEAGLEGPAGAVAIFGRYREGGVHLRRAMNAWCLGGRKPGVVRVGECEVGLLLGA